MRNYVVPQNVFPAYEEARVAKLRSMAVMGTAPHPLLDTIVSFAAATVKCPIAAISLVDQDRHWFMSKVGLTENEIPRHASFCSYTILNQGRCLVIPDATATPEFRNNPLVTGNPRVRFYAGFSIVTKDRFAIGSLCVIDTVPRQIDEHQIIALKRMAAIASDYMDRLVTPA